MKKIFWIIFVEFMFLSLISGASYPSPFTDNTAIVVGSNVAPSNNIVGSSLTTIDGSDTYQFEETSTKFSLESDSEEKMFSEKEICQLMKGCWSENECYPYGYRVEEKYCGFDKDFKEKYKFDKFSVVNQSESDEFCENSFECKSNFCFNGKCVETLVEGDREVISINKSDLDELRSILEDTEEMMEKDYDKNTFRSFFSSLIDLFKRMFSW